MQHQPAYPFVSVIIPVFNDSARLRRCLAALAAQTYPQDRFEVIVVDNGSTEDIAAVVGEFPGVRLAAEAQPGSYAARNAGLALATGEVLAFTDSDCLPRPNWMERGVAQLQAHPSAGLVAGAIRVFFHDPTHPTPTELYESITAFPQRKYVEKYHYGATANVFTWRRIMDRVGLFDASLKSGGDRQWGQRVHAAGLPLVYADDVEIQHPARRTFGELSHKLVRVTGGMERLRAEKPGSFPSFAKAVVKDLVPPLGKIRGVLAEPSLPGWSQRVQVVAVMLGLRYTQAWARVRARAGWLQVR